MSVVDLFAGPGGWDLPAHQLGLDVLGVEFDDAACATREAAGLNTLQSDVSALDPKDFPCDGLIASPPCQAFSMAGKGEGRKAIDRYCELIDGYEGEITEADLAPIKFACNDERAHLVLEPLRWAWVLRPDWIALEQVEPVLPIWEAMQRRLSRMGYSTWVGVLSAEQYGVPQTRRRAFLIASKVGEVSAPRPTHQRYIAPRAKSHEKQEDSLFDAGDRGRVVHPNDRDLLPWISMSEALGWVEGPSPSPSPSITGGGGATGGIEVFASKGARHRVALAVDTRGDSGRANDSLDADAMPSRTITGKFYSWQYRASAQKNAAVRPATAPAPAPTIAFGHDVASAGWIEDRPATTVVGSYCPDVISPPGYRKAGDGPRQNQDGAVRVTQQEAAILQSFPADYPWQGSKTKQFQQIGNAVPPMLALAVLGAVVPAVAEVRGAA